MATPTRDFPIADAVVSFGGYTVTGGYAEDSAIKITFDEPQQVKKVVGLLGDVVISKSNNKAGKCVISLLQGCEADNYLINLYNGFITSPGGVVNSFPFQAYDPASGLNVRSTYAWVEEVPEIEWGGTATKRDWSVGLAKIEMSV